MQVMYQQTYSVCIKDRQGSHCLIYLGRVFSESNRKIAVVSATSVWLHEFNIRLLEIATISANMVCFDIKESEVATKLANTESLVYERNPRSPPYQRTWSVLFEGVHDRHCLSEYSEVIWER